ncbi:MAG: hypothetical protein JWM67_1232 [Mycobacterium sp.]|jgi:uncharacterized protein YecE (DUF72 family)|nr:hypothetical protein [Mycobacterium sp.]
MRPRAGRYRARMGVYVGTSGWSYEHWKGVFYPPTVRPPQRLRYYAERFDTVELNTSFYRWPPVASFLAWRDQLPPDFQLTVKASRWLTHGRRLKDPDIWLGRMAPALQELGDRRGPLLVQLRPDHARDDARLEGFLERVPPWLRVAVEFRHPSWHTEEVFALLERYAAAYCVMSGADLPCVPRVTAPFAYVRLHGPDPGQLYGGSYSDAQLAGWADRIREWEADGRDVFAYFNNDGHGYAVHNAARLKQLLGR